MTGKTLIGTAAGLVLILPALALVQDMVFDSSADQEDLIVAENLIIPDGSDQTTEQINAMPTRGMTMQQVEESFGQPQSRRSPVGDPPIARWEYSSFVVYFEYRHVIHAVPKIK